MSRYNENRLAVLRAIMKGLQKGRRAFLSLDKNDKTAITINALIRDMKELRRHRRYIGNNALKHEVNDEIYIKMRGIIKTQTARTSSQISITCGPKAGISAVVSGNKHLFNVGYMWDRTVFQLFYTNCTIRHKVFIMTAERMRLNHPSVEIYEARVCNLVTKMDEKGYIAITKSPLRTVTYGNDAITAVKKAEHYLNIERNKHILERD